MTISVAYVGYRSALATVDILTQLALLRKQGRKPAPDVRLGEAWVDSFWYAEWSHNVERLKKIFKR